ncbi:MAG TPA: hypothetical protein ENL40_05510 [Thermococcus litoralis]|uniref:Uncharacterized protein n=1 Tax=Thermococcus litoralis TaxID=2265 RepID=A0A7C5NZX4_THELI|nr:hypothetical protein [Thermococcus litoralis]
MELELYSCYVNAKQWNNTCKSRHNRTNKHGNQKCNKTRKESKIQR